MKEVVIAIIILVVIGSWFAIRARAQTARTRDPQGAPKTDAADAGRKLRQRSAPSMKPCQK